MDRVDQQIDDKRYWEAEINDALADLANALVSSISPEDLAAMVLQHGKRLTGSKFGYCGYIDPETGYLVSPTLSRDIWDVCQVMDKEVVFKKFTGLFGWVLTNKKSLYTNSPGDDPRSIKVPDGHLPIERFLSAPAMVRGKLVGQLALANSHRDYTHRDLELVERLASYYALAIQRKWDEQRLEQINKFNVAVLNSLTSHLVVLDNNGDIVAVNEAWKKFARKNNANEATILAIGLNYLEVCRRGAEAGCSTSAKALTGIESVLKGTRARFNLEYTCHGSGEKRWFLLNATPLSNGAGGAVVSHTDITVRVKNEERQHAELAILSELTNFEDLKQAINNVLKILTGVMGCQAAAIRLAEGDDFTYFAHTGFPASFVAREHSLCSLAEDKTTEINGQGEPVLECLCGKVLHCQLTESAINNHYLTDYGSFVAGSLSWMQKDTTGPLQLKGPWRLTCLKTGYETLVLVPIKNEGENIGLLQLNGTHKNQVTHTDMPFLELVSRHIASAINHLKDAQALRESEERYRRLAENAPDAIYRVNLVPHIYYGYISLAVESLTGYTPDEYYADPNMYYEIVYPEDRGKLATIFNQSNQGKPVELRWVRKDGKIIWIEQRNLLIRDKNGQVVALEGIARDITERKKIELTRQRQALQDRVMAGAMAILTGYDERHEVLKKLIDLLTKRFGYQMGAYYAYDEWIRSFKKVICRPEAVEEEKVSLYLAEQPIIDAAYDLRTLILKAKDQGPAGMVDANPLVRVAIPVHYQRMVKGVLLMEVDRDMEKDEIKFLEKVAIQLGITLNGIKQFEDLKRLSRELGDRQREIERKNRELEYANKTKNEFLTNMSHELRTPLNSVIGFSELLERQLFGGLNERQLEYVSDIKESGAHLLALINDILDLSKIEAGAMELDLGDVFLPDLLQGSVRLLRERAMQKKIQLNLWLDDEVGFVTVDARKIKQVIFNLLSNAIKFTPEGGQVDLTTTLKKDNVLVSIRDTGIGISDEDQDKIFMEFAQVDGSLTRRHEGTGLGLALSKKLVTMHGGKIWVESRLGVGSEFTFSIPVLTDPILLDTRPKELASAIDLDYSHAKEPLVLVVEDDERAAELMETYLNEEGYRVVLAAHGQQGLDMARKLYPHLIILNTLLPGMGGWDLLKELQADRELKYIPVILIALDQDLQKGLALGASEVLVKPLDLNQLASTLDHFISQNIIPVSRHAPGILVIDDDPRAVDIISHILTGQGYHIMKAYGGAEGIRRAREEKVDLILLDLVMPEIDGFSVVKTIKSDPRLKDVPIIVLTAKRLTRGDFEKIEGLVEVVKEKGNFSPNLLLAKVRKVLSGLDVGKVVQ